MKSLYYQFVNYIQTMKASIFLTIWLFAVALILILIMKFFKRYNGEQKSFEKLSYIILAVLLFVVVVFLTYIRN